MLDRSVQQAAHFRILDDAAAVADAAVEEILTAARRALAARGRFRIVLAGGSTPLAAYRRLAGRGGPWDGWECYFGDERCLPAGDPGRNDRAVTEAWFDPAGVPAGARFPIPAELGAARAAAAYEALVHKALPFDLVLLGMGEDGHTASLFPGRGEPPGRLVMPVYAAPKPPPERVSLTRRALCHSRRVLLLVTGGAKAPALCAWRAGADLPVARIHSLGAVLVLADRAACSGCDEEVS